MAELSLAHDRGGSGEPLVLVHGVGSCWRCWDPVVPHLREHHDVIAVDLPGFGESPPVEGEPTVYAITDALDHALVDAGLDGAHLAGSSMGGFIVAELAARRRARSAVAIAPFGLATRKENAFLQATLGPSQGTAQKLEPHVDRLTRSALGRALLFSQSCARPWRIDPASAAHQVRMFAGSPSYQDTLRWMTSSGAQPRELDRISCPFRVIWGTLDFVLPHRQAKRWVEVVPRAELVTLRGAGHIPMVDDPKTCAEKILAVTAPTRSAAPPQPAAARA